MLNKYTKLLDKINQSHNVIIMSHKNIDLDGLGSALGCFNICKSLNKDAYIIMEDNVYDNTIISSQEYLNENKFFPNFIGINEINSFVHKNTLLIIVDVSNEKLFIEESILSIKNKVIIDHHILKEKLNEDILMVHDTKVSSACEIVADICKKKKIELNEFVSTILLAGIVIDTTHFKYKVSSKTFNAVEFLFKNNASMNVVNNITQIPLADYQKYEQIKKNAYILNDNYLIAYDKENIYKRSDLSFVSKELLSINSIDVSIVVAKLSDDSIGISINSINDYNAALLVSNFNGGGHNHSAAAQVDNKNINDILLDLKNFIEKEI